MTSFGSIISYDPSRRTGMLKPDSGGDAIAFTSADQSDFFPDPRPFERYSYVQRIATDGGQPRAVHLRRQLSHREQAEMQAG
ncbi:MAG: hypothetical protein ACTHKM_11780 [Tsuneonella sp.]